MVHKACLGELEAGGFAGHKCVKEITFDNSTGTVPLFTVTGDVIVRVIVVVKTNVASVGGCNGEVGIVGATDAIIATTDLTLLAAGEIWHDTTPDAKIEALSTMRDFIITTDGDMALTLSAQADSGAVTFYCLWAHLSDDGAVTPA